MPIVPFVGPNYIARGVDVSVQRSVNLYPEIVETQNAKSQYILIGTPGTSTFSDLSDVESGDCRGMWYTSTEQLYVVYGGNLYEIDSGGDETLVQNIGFQSPPVSMTDNGTHLVVVDGYNMWTIRLSNNFVINEVLPFNSPSQVVYLGQRIVCINTDSATSNQFFWSKIGDALTWETLSTASAESSADPIKAIQVRQGEIWLLGSRSYEVRRLVADPDQPFAFVGGSSSEIGIAASHSSAAISENIFWLGSSSAGKNQVFMSDGYNARRISTHSIEFELDKISDVSGNPLSSSDAQAFAYQQEGHTFYVVSLVQGDKTFVYDLTTDQWHERATRDSSLNVLHRWAPSFSAFAFDKVLVGNNQGSEILELSLNNYEEWDSRPIVRIRQSPCYWNDLKTMLHREFQLDLEVGVGLNTGQGSDPQAMLQYSDDGGHTWSSEYWKTIGEIGEYRTSVRWRSMGSCRDRVYRITISDPVKIIMMNARVIAEESLVR